MTKKIAIIGAGLAGLVCANILKDKYQITIFEKSRGVGGRMATRYKDDFIFDHGAQYFTAKSLEFKNFLEPLIKKEIIARWDARFIEFDFDKILEKRNWSNDYPHFVATPKMNNLAKFLSNDLEIKLKTKITKLEKKQEKWQLVDENQNHYLDFDLVILAIPSHQALELIPQNFEYFNQVKNVKMLGCFALMIGLKQLIELDFEAALVKNSKISWISLNHSKPQRESNFSLLINSSNDYAEENIEQNLEIVKSDLIKELSNILKFDFSKADHIDIHRWRYANSSKIEGQKFFFDEKQNLAICGDWCIQGRVESAFLSGFSLAKKLSS